MSKPINSPVNFLYTETIVLFSSGKKKFKYIDLKTYSTENKPEIESMFICSKHIHRNQRAKAAPPPQRNHQNRFYHHLQSEYTPSNWLVLK